KGSLTHNATKYNLPVEKLCAVSDDIHGELPRVVDEKHGQPELIGCEVDGRFRVFGALFYRLMYARIRRVKLPVESNSVTPCAVADDGVVYPAMDSELVQVTDMPACGSFLPRIP